MITLFFSDHSNTLSRQNHNDCSYARRHDADSGTAEDEAAFGTDSRPGKMTASTPVRMEPVHIG